LKYQSSELELDKKKLIKLHAAIGLKKVEYQGGTFDRIISECAGINFEYLEDGLLVLEKKFQNFDNDLKFLNNFYDQKLVPIFSYLYSRGAPLPALALIAPIHRIRPTVIVAQEAKEKEINDLLLKIGNELPHAKVIEKNYQVYFAPKYILIVTKQSRSAECLNLIHHYIFFREYENQLHKYLNINRYLWDRVAEIFKRETVKYKELPELREKLLDYREKNTLIKNRLNQMDNYLAVRMNAVVSENLLDFLTNYKANRFLKIRGIHDYITKLWQMTDESLGSAA
jgi:hypothetical protein